MGKVHPTTKDTFYFGIRSNKSIKKLVEISFDYAKMNAQQQKEYQDIMKNCVDDFRNREIQDPVAAFGWKFGETLFTVPVLLDVLPSAKVIHLIRDGRDVMLSRIDARFEEKIHEPFNKLIIFGRHNPDSLLGAAFDEDLVAKHRNALEMLHWSTCINYGIGCRRYTNQYLEIHYEQLCRHPIRILSKVFNFIDVPFKSSCQEWAKSNIRTDRLGKWKDLSKDEMAFALRYGEGSLRKMGYVR